MKKTLSYPVSLHECCGKFLDTPLLLFVHEIQMFDSRLTICVDSDDLLHLRAHLIVRLQQIFRREEISIGVLHLVK